MQLTDTKEKEFKNREVRNKRKGILREFILNQKNLFGESDLYILGIEKKGPYICVYVIPDRDDHSYDRLLIPGIDTEPLFQAELACVDSGSLGENASIPYISYHDNNRIECIVIEPRTDEEGEQFSSGYAIACERRSREELAPYMKADSEVRD